MALGSRVCIINDALPSGTNSENTCAKCLAVALNVRSIASSLSTNNNNNNKNNHNTNNIQQQRQR